MANPTATLNREGVFAMNFPAQELDEAEQPRGGALKFTYPSGSRPLEGYTIKRGVGRGGFGEVYFATSDAGKEVALKLIRRNLDVELRGVRQCLNLKHPNLIALYDIRSDEMGDQWVVMEYVSGEALEEVIDRHPNGMPAEEALWWMRGICQGVAYLHDHGIVHRDLKPGNVFLDEGTVKIGDYGLAKFISCSRRSGQTESVGTVHYMAPEIANGRYGREIDTYALGIILFEMMTGRVPFEGESVGEVLMKHLTAEPDLSSLQEPYREIVRRALAKDPALRISSVVEMMSLLPGAETASSPRYQRTAATEPPVRPATLSVDGGSATAENAPLEEPIWKAIRTGFYKLQSRFFGDGARKMHPTMKALLIFAVVAVLISGFFHVAFAVAWPLLICYGVYYLIWSILVQNERNSKEYTRAVAAVGANGTAAANQETIAWNVKEKPAAAATEQQIRAEMRRRARFSWRDRANREIAARPLREKLSELLGSMLLAAVFAALVAGMAPVLLADQPGSDRMAMYLWLTIIGTLGTWAILVPAKFTEGKLEDQVPMRLTLLALGTLVGLAAWFVGDALLVYSPRWGEPVDVGIGLVSHEFLKWPKPNTMANQPLPAYLAYFAFLFLVPGWWRQAECTRPTRLSLWWVVRCVGWAWLLHIFWYFPQPMGMMLAGTMAVATQLASPWMPPSRRRVLATEAEQGVV
jgi:serine/threonine protein kinase